MKSIELPMMNVRDVVFYPGMSQNLLIGRPASAQALRHALSETNGRIIILTQKAIQKAAPDSVRDMFKLGAICLIERAISLADGTMKVSLQVQATFEAEAVLAKDGVRYARGRVVQAKSVRPGRRISEEERLDLLKLLIQWKPALALDSEQSVLEGLKKEKDISRFLLKLQHAIAGPALKRIPWSRQDLIRINRGLRERQRLLTETTRGGQILLIRRILSTEICHGMKTCRR